MFLARGDKPVQGQCIFPYMRVDQEGHFGMQLAERGVSRKRHLNDIADSAHVDKHLVWSFFGKPSAKLANHRSPVLPLFFRPSTRSRESAAVFANELCLGKDVAFHRALNIGLRRAGFQTQLRIERIQLEEIPVRLPRRRTRTAITNFAEIVAALASAAGKLLLLRDAFRKFSVVCWKIVE